MQIWEMESYATGDQRMPHHKFPPKMLNTSQLQSKAGVIHYKVDMEDTQATKKRLSKVKGDYSVVNGDVFTMDENVIDFNQKLRTMYEPIEKHEDAVFLVLEGAIYFDVEYEEDEWIRIQCERGDLVVIPKDVCFRYTVTPSNFVKLQRFTHPRCPSTE
jgi:1,2-dihydroxy-3-keto-5-methylthiopentene dioxygenase